MYGAALHLTLSYSLEHLKPVSTKLTCYNVGLLWYVLYKLLRLT